MKIRMGFVSNSSSSSFCVLKADIPDRKLFEKMIEQHNNSNDDGYIVEGKRYYVGRLDQHDLIIHNYLGEHNIFYESVY